MYASISSPEKWEEYTFYRMILRKKLGPVIVRDAWNIVSIYYITVIIYNSPFEILRWIHIPQEDIQ